MNTSNSLIIVLIALLWPSLASAHIDLQEPPHRYDRASQKVGPCGKADGERGDGVTVYEAGQVITVVWNEYIPHPGHFRISFSANRDEDFVDPQCLAKCDTREMEVELYGSDTVLIDGIAARPRGGIYEVDVQLPDITCESCTLQLIQVMTDKPPYTLPGNDLYYNCANLTLIRSEPGDVGLVPDAGSPDVGSPDAGLPDAGLPDAGLPDAGSPDAGSPDAGSPDAGSPDAGSPDADASQGSNGGCGGCTSTGGSLPTIPAGALLLLGWFVVANLSRNRHSCPKSGILPL